MKLEEIRDQHLKKSKESIDDAIVKQNDLMARFDSEEAAIELKSRKLEFEKYINDFIMARLEDYRHKLENLKLSEQQTAQESEYYQHELVTHYSSYKS